MATLTPVQWAESTYAANPTATFSAGPTSGNLLVVAAMARSGTAATSHTISGSGWTKTVERSVQISDGTYRRSLSVWWKQAGGSEPSGITVSGDTFSVMALEFQSSAAATWGLEASASNDNGLTTDAITLATGTTASCRDGIDLLLVGIYGAKTNVTDYPTATWASEALTEYGDAPTTNTQYITRVSGGYLQQTTGGTKASTASQNSAENSGLVAAILVFNTDGGGATSIAPQVAYFNMLMSS